MNLKLRNINPPPPSLFRIFTKYDDVPEVIKVSVFPMLKPVIRRRNTNVTAFYPFGEEYYWHDYKIANIRFGLEGVKFVRYKK